MTTRTKRKTGLNNVLLVGVITTLFLSSNLVVRSQVRSIDLFPDVLALGSSSVQMTSYGLISNSARTPTWLHVEGRWIKDENGNIVILKGACEMSLAYGIYGVTSWDDHSNHLSVQTFDIAKQAGANIIRLGINLKSVLNSEYVSKIKQVVQWCKERGMWVLLDMDGPDDLCLQGEAWMPVLLDPNGTGFYAAWTTWAQLFKNEPTVCAFGLMNEPPPAGTEGYTYDQLQAIWRSVAIETIHRIHAINPNVLIFVDNIQWSSDLQQFIDNPLNEPNVVYCLHRYYFFDWQNNVTYATAYASGNFAQGYALMKQFYYDKGFKLQDRGYPVVMEEFGSYREDPKFPCQIPPNSLRQINDTYSLFREWQVGYMQFAFSGEIDGYSLHLAMLTDDWSALNEVGLIWAQNL